METEKRKPRAYKISDKYYTKAMRKAQKNNKHLANLIEDFVINYGTKKYYTVTWNGEEKQSIKNK